VSAFGIVIIVLMFAALAVAIYGFIQILRSDKNQAKRSNKLMMLRIAIQATVILIIFVTYWLYK